MPVREGAMGRRGAFASLVGFSVGAWLRVGAILGAVFFCGALCGGCAPREEAAGGAGNVRVATQALAATCNYAVLTAHNDAQRTGMQRCETVLAPHTVPYLQKVAQLTVGVITGQPLVVQNISVNGVNRKAVIVAANPTRPGAAPAIYALNPATLAPIAQAKLPSATALATGGGNSYFGVLGTPVIDVPADGVSHAILY